MRSTTEQLANETTHERNTRRAANENHFVHVARLETRVTQSLAARHERALDDRPNHALELLTSQSDAKHERLVLVRQVPFRLNDGLANFLHRLVRAREPGGGWRRPLLCSIHDAGRHGEGGRGRLEVCQHALDQKQIDVVTAKMCVAISRQHLEHTVFNAQDGDVEGAAAEIVDRDDARLPLVQTVGQRSRRRLVDDAEHLEAGDAASVARRRALGIVEVGRHRDDGFVHFGIDITLGGKVFFGASLQLTQDECGNLGRRELALAEADAHNTARLARHLEGQQRRFALHVVDTLAHETFHGVDRAPRVGQQTPLGLASDEDGAVLRGRHDRRHERIVVRVADHDRQAVLDDGDEAVRGSEIDTDDFGHIH